VIVLNCWSCQRRQVISAWSADHSGAVHGLQTGGALKQTWASLSNMFLCAWVNDKLKRAEILYCCLTLICVNLSWLCRVKKGGKSVIALYRISLIFFHLDLTNQEERRKCLKWRHDLAFYVTGFCHVAYLNDEWHDHLSQMRSFYFHATGLWCD
jgi:hypothetical protein